MASGLPLIFLVLALLFVAGIVGLIILLIARARQPRVQQASCGKCRYAVEGLSTMTCPECGSDLRAVGIITPRSSPRAGPQLWVILWTILLPLPALLISRMIVVAWPTSYTNQRYVTLRPSNDMQAFDAVDIELTAHDADQPEEFEWLLMELQREGNGVGEPLVVQLDTQQWRIGEEDGEPLSDQRITSTDVARWIADAADAESEEPYLPTAVSLLEVVQQGVAGSSVSVRGAFNSVRLNTVQSRSKPDWLTPVLWILWLAVWGVGVLVILNRARRISKPEPETNSRIIDVSAE